MAIFSFHLLECNEIHFNIIITIDLEQCLIKLLAVSCITVTEILTGVEMENAMDVVFTFIYKIRGLFLSTGRWNLRKIMSVQLAELHQNQPNKSVSWHRCGFFFFYFSTTLKLSSHSCHSEDC